MQASSNQTSSVPNLSAEQWASLTTLLEQQKPTPVSDKLNDKEQTGDGIHDG